MHLDSDPDGLVHLTLEPDEHIFVNMGSAEALLMGGPVDAPGTGPLVQVKGTDQAAKAVVDSPPVRVGNADLGVQFSPLEDSEEEPDPCASTSMRPCAAKPSSR